MSNYRKEEVMAKLAGKTAVVTGASKGIGAAIAETLGRNGASVVVNYAADRKGAERVVKAIATAGGKAVAVQADVTRQAEVEKLFAETEKIFGRIDVLVNNAGVYEFRPIEQVDEIHYRKLFDINVLGLLLTTQAAVGRMNGHGGSIINIGSVVSKQPIPGSSVYAATKGAVDVITQELAQELGPRKIRVNALLPGVTDTEGFRAMTGEDRSFAENAVSRTPLGRIGTGADIADAALFLASDDSRWITGEAVQISGGLRP
jgi:3-oxoacyl-[acyl-carrier protein] reductase